MAKVAKVAKTSSGNRRRLAFIIPDTNRSAVERFQATDDWRKALDHAGASAVVLPEAHDSFWYGSTHQSDESASNFIDLVSWRLGRPAVVGVTVAFESSTRPYSYLGFGAAGEGALGIRIKLSQTSCSPLESWESTREDLKKCGTPVTLAGMRLGTVICYDHRLTLLARRLGDTGLDAYVCMSGSDAPVARWSLVLRARALELGVPSFALCHSVRTGGGNQARFMAFGADGGDLLVDAWNVDGHVRRLPWFETEPSVAEVYTIDLDSLTDTGATWKYGPDFTGNATDDGPFTIGIRGSGATLELKSAKGVLRLGPEADSSGVASLDTAVGRAFVGVLDGEALFDGDAVHDMAVAMRNAWDEWHEDHADEDDGGQMVILSRWAPDSARDWRRVYAVAASRALEFKTAFVVAEDPTSAACFAAAPATPNVSRRRLDSKSPLHAVPTGANATQGYARLFTTKGLKILDQERKPAKLDDDSCLFENYCILEKPKKKPTKTRKAT